MARECEITKNMIFGKTGHAENMGRPSICKTNMIFKQKRHIRKLQGKQVIPDKNTIFKKAADPKTSAGRL